MGYVTNEKYSFLEKLSLGQKNIHASDIYGSRKMNVFLFIFIDKPFLQSFCENYNYLQNNFYNALSKDCMKMITGKLAPFGQSWIVGTHFAFLVMQLSVPSCDIVCLPSLSPSHFSHCQSLPTQQMSPWGLSSLI